MTTSTLGKHRLDEPFPLLHKRKKLDAEEYPFSPTPSPMISSLRKRSFEPSENELEIIGKKYRLEEALEPMEFTQKEEENMPSITSQNITEVPSDFNTWNYWKLPLPKVEIEEVISTPIVMDCISSTTRSKKRSREN
jgi:hypothetical protein